MKSIINPWWIYLAEKSENIGIGFLVVGIFAAIIFCIWYFTLVMEGYEIKEIKIPKFIIVLAIVGILIGGLLPSQKTILTMLTVSQLTPNNIKLVGDTVEGTIDYIIENIEELTDEEND
jgi:hypothetical protein